MRINKMKHGIKVYLNNMPTEDELIQLNLYGNFYICEKRGYKRLIHKVPSTITPSISTEFECPIKQTFTV